MEFIRGLHTIQSSHRGCVATIGNFDGIHLGHQAILQRLNEVADEMALPSLVITFEPHPQDFFLKDAAHERLMTLREKVMAMKPYLIDRLLCIRFNEAFSSLSAQAFVEKVLMEQLGIKFLLVGDDFRFGHKRQGDFALLQKLGEQLGFPVEATDTFEVDDSRVSSSRVRKLLACGSCDEANHLLGRPYQMTGRVVKGDQRGRQWGFPTANIALKARTVPLRGIFVVRVFIDNESQPIYGAASVGTRPTVDGVNFVLEIFLFDFDRAIYGKRLCVQFLHYLREERHYETIDALKTQMTLDVEQAKAYIKENVLP